MDADKALGHILNLTRQMLDLSEQGDWETLPDILEQRNEAMEALNAMDLSQSGIRETLLEIKNINDRIITNGAQDREQVIQQMRTLKAGKQASRAYKG